MEPKRITLDLTKIFTDYRKRAFVSIRPEWKNIECLQTHILNLFGLEHFVYLTDPNGVVFPAAERLDVIRNNEEIVVCKITLDKLLKPNPAPLDDSSDDTLEEEIKRDNLVWSPKSKFWKRRPTNSDSDDTTTAEEDGSTAKKEPEIDLDDTTTTEEEVKKTNGSAAKKEPEIDLEEIKRLRTDSASRLKRPGTPPSALNETPTKRRRKRVRKSKAKDSKMDPQPSTSKIPTAKTNILKPSTTWLNDAKNKHVRFSDNASSSSTSSSSETDSSDVQITKVCKYTSETHVGARKVSAMIRFWDNQTQSYGPREAVETPSETNTEPDRPRVLSLRLDIPAAVVPTIGPILPSNIYTDHLSEAEVPTVPPAKTPTTALPIGPSMDTLEVLRKDIEQLDLPLVEYAKLKVYDTIAFKLLRMDDQCQPTVSGYIIGCVEKASATNDEMSIRLLAGKGEIGSRICRTVITEENEIGTIEEDCIDVTFKELYEPRCCLLTL